MQQAKRAAERTVKRLKEKLRCIIDAEGIELVENDENEMEELFSNTDKEMEGRSNFQKIFWEQQRKYNKSGKKQGMRWHPLMIRFALNCHLQLHRKLISLTIPTNIARLYTLH